MKILLVLLFVFLNTIVLNANETDKIVKEVNETKAVVQKLNTTIKSVNNNIANINSSLSQMDENIDKVVQKTNATVKDVNSSLSQMDEKMKANTAMILKGIDGIKYEHKNRSVRYKDIEFLYDIVIGNNYKFNSSKCYSNGSEHNVTGVTVDYKDEWFSNDFITLDNNSTNTSETGGSVDKYKLLAVEEVLGLNQDNKVTNDRQRIKNIYEEIGYDDWNRDRIQFTIFVDYLNKSSAVVNSLGVVVFPSYKKYIPGNFNLANRYALYFALGNATSFDSAIEFEGMVYSGGLNIEIQKGFGIHAGYSLYSVKTQDSDYKQSKSIVVGVTLSSELWKNLFGAK